MGALILSPFVDRARFEAVAAELAERYPELAGVLGPLFDAACAAAEAALAGTAPCDHRGIGRPGCPICDGRGAA